MNRCWRLTTRHIAAMSPDFDALGQSDAGRLLHITFTLRGGGSLLRDIGASDEPEGEDTYEKENA